MEKKKAVTVGFDSLRLQQDTLATDHHLTRSAPVSSKFQPNRGRDWQ
jgi:hypothetical protein